MSSKSKFKLDSIEKIELPYNLLFDHKSESKCWYLARSLSGGILFSIYESGHIVHFSEKNGFTYFPNKIDFIHGLYETKKYILASRFRRNEILILNRYDASIVRSFKTPGRSPINAFIGDESITFIDYTNSCLVEILLKSEQHKVYSEILKQSQHPHCLYKDKKRQLIITQKFPHILIIEDYKCTFSFPLPQKGKWFSLCPINEHYILATHLETGLYLLNIMNPSIEIILSEANLTGVITTEDDTFYAINRDAEYIYRIQFEFI